MIYCTEVNSILKQFMPLSSILTLAYNDYINIVKTIFKVRCDICSASEMNKILHFILPCDRIKMRDKIRNDKALTDYVYKIRTLINKGYKIPFLSLDDMLILKSMPEPLDDNQIGKYCEKTLKSLYNYIKGLTYKKLNKLFYINNDVDAEDIISKVYLIAYDECRNAIMSKRGEYLTNYLKLKINSAMLNTLGYYTSNKRSITIKDTDSEGNTTYTKRVVNESVNSDDEDDLNIFNIIGDNSTINEIDNSNLRYDLLKKLKVFASGSSNGEVVSKKIVEIILNKSNEFIEFCNKKYDKKFYDSLDVLETCGKTRFLELIRNYLDMPLSKIKKYSQSILEVI